MKEIYADLTQDLVFKKAFASEQDKELLISLLNAFLERKLKHPITDVTIKNPYIQGETLKNRDSIVDIHCEDASGTRFIVEMQVSPQHFFIKRAIHYICVSVSSGSKKGEDYNFDFPKTYSLNFLDFEIDFGKNCTEVVQYYSFSNEAHPENRLDYLSMVFVLLPRFGKSIDECETLHDKLLYSLCHAHEHNEQPEQLRGNVFDRLFTVIKISNFSSMEQDEYIAKAMFRADQREQLRYARDEGMVRILEYLKEGHTIAEAEALLEQDKHARAMFRADQREQLRYAEDKGIEKTAIAMKARGFDYNLIADITGLSVAKIEDLTFDLVPRPRA